MFAASFAVEAPGAFGFAGMAMPSLGALAGASFAAGVFTYNMERILEYTTGVTDKYRWNPIDMAVSGAVATGTTVEMYLAGRGLALLWNRIRWGGSAPYVPPGFSGAGDTGGLGHVLDPEHIPAGMTPAEWQSSVEDVAASPFGTTLNKPGKIGSIAWGRVGGDSTAVVVWPQGIRTAFVHSTGFYGTSGIFPWYAVVSGWLDYI